ncbi:putative Fe-S protein [Methyloglobulus morosus KoM1]|uniref:Putative Fe-S protein n=2 Tax=Methyloglobulus TaxID=1410680 RepID=V5B9K5_9GAMM|nr:putative Fe-S protein [Methyloglobulus morosus KoM1]
MQGFLNDCLSAIKMNDDLEKPVLSPCIRNCCLNEEDICLGCFRSLTEIVGWADANNVARKSIMNNTEARRAAHYAKYRRSSG